MNEAARFFANMIVLEEETAAHCMRLAQTALDASDTDLEAFFQSLAETSRMDIAEAIAEGASRRHASFKPELLGESLVTIPSMLMRSGFATLMSTHYAIAYALSLVRRNHGYYASIAVSAKQLRLRRYAKAYERERAAHIAAMEHWILRLTT